MKSFKLTVLVCFAFVLIMGCAGKSQQAAIDPDIPDDSPFAKVEEGMSMQQVKDLIGEPREENTTSSGKQYIPFYFGGDYMHTVFYYEDLGRITFNSSKKVIQVEHDESEDGYIGEE